MTDMKSTIAELRKMNDKDRAKMLLDLQKESAQLKPLLATGKEKQNHKAKFLRQQIARLLTINSENHAQ